jgi:hypothetical protein
MKLKKASNRVLNWRKSSNRTRIAVDPASEIPIGTPTTSKANKIAPRIAILILQTYVCL